MKIPKLTIVSGMFGSMLVLGSIVWFFIYKDFSQCFLAFLLGMVILDRAYSYWWIRKHDNFDREMQIENFNIHKELHKAVDLNNMYIREEIEKMKKTKKGKKK